MGYSGISKLVQVPAVVVFGCLLSCACHGQGEARPGGLLGTLKADRILVLGNSITLHGVAENIGWKNYCGMAASVPEKDYVHLLAAGIEARTGGKLRIDSSKTPHVGADGAIVPGDANVLNIADIIERRYGTYQNSHLQSQLDWKPDVVVLQCGENVVRETFDPAAFKTALQTLTAGLKASSNPHIFVVSQLLGAGGALDDIKREVCAEDPAQRVFVDLSSFGQDPANFAGAEPYYTGVIVGHPGDKGMAVIAGALLKAMVTHGEPQAGEPVAAGQ